MRNGQADREKMRQKKGGKRNRQQEDEKAEKQKRPKSEQTKTESERGERIGQTLEGWQGPL